MSQVVDAGMTVMRLNFSHATKEEVELRLSSLKKSDGMFALDGAHKSLRPVMLDTKGPEIRTGNLQAVKNTGDKKAKINLVTGDEITLTNDLKFKECSDAKVMYVTYPSLATTAGVGGSILLDDGAVTLKVLSHTAGGDVVCRVENDGEIASRRGVNLPGMKVDLPAMSEKDRADIRYGVGLDMDFVAASFVRSAAAVREIRAHIAACHAEFWPADYPMAKIIAKIESTEALERLGEITDEADGIMVARGDLGVEVPIEEVVIWQKEMVERCIAQAKGKPVIVATQMLESMQKAPRPTRAEVSDVTNAVLDGADCVMLSGESANGKYPVESVKMMASIVRKTEEWMPPISDLDVLAEGSDSAADSVAASAVFGAEKLGAGLIVVRGDASGDLSRLVAKFRPSMPVVALVGSAKAARQLSIHRGVFPTLLALEEALPAAKAQGLIEAGDAVVTVEQGPAGELSMAFSTA